ncbi:hypothetical protein HZC07_01940, partial [Candidatus Micrarchaeota archaeon]|nr:hypothetical protein [Candidatus Micrarchaeota archaeon]
YDISIDVVDDNGNPVNSSIMIFNKSFVTEGHFKYNKTFGQAIPYSVEYRGIVKTCQLTQDKPLASIVYDISPPTIGNIQTQINGSRTKMIIPVTDLGKYASGVDLSSISVTYKVEPTDPTVPPSNAITFTVGRNTFAAEFPELPSGKIVQFKIEVKDKEGNKAIVDGKFSTLVQPPKNNSTTNTQNQSNTQTKPQEEQGIPLLYIIIGVIVVLLVIFLVFFLKSKAEKGTE